MHSAGLIAGAVCLGMWSYLLLGHGGFWKVWRLGSHAAPRQSFSGTIAVVIPARDEAKVIASTVSSLLNQTWPNSLRIIVVDDQSSDQSGEIARQTAVECGRPEAVVVIEGRELPVGWTGKVWAVQQGVEFAVTMQPEYLLLTDADIHHSRENIAELIAVAEEGHYDLTSYMVKLHCRSLAERLLVPPFVFFFFLLYPPSWVCDPKHKLAGAAGGCMLIRPKTLERVGGIAAIRDQIIDDCALARAVKRTGGRVWLGVTPNTYSTREYRSFGEIEHMIARTAFNQLSHSPLLLLGAVLGLAITYLLPLALILSGDTLLMALGAFCGLVMATVYLPMVRFYALNPVWAFTLPFTACFYMAATIDSALKFWSGRGGEWKGRAQDVASPD